jgi:hypothetical protein
MPADVGREASAARGFAAPFNDSERATFFAFVVHYSEI